MALSLEIDLSQELKKLVENALEREMEKELDKAIKELNDRKREIISGILLGVMKTVDIERIGDRIIFSIKEIESNKSKTII